VVEDGEWKLRHIRRFGSAVTAAESLGFVMFLSSGRRARHCRSEACSPSPDTIYRRLVSQWQQPDEIATAGHEPAGPLVDVTIAGDFPELVPRMQFLDLVTYLPDDILTKVDRATMAVGLEGRVPLLDHRVVAYAWTLPRRFKIRGGEGKWLLRRVLDRYVPRRLIDRPKMGFAVPIDSWLRGPLRDWAETLLAPNKAPKLMDYQSTWSGRTTKMMDCTKAWRFSCRKHQTLRGKD